MPCMPESLMSINTGFSILAKPPAWGCGMNYAPVLLLSRFSAMSAFSTYCLLMATAHTAWQFAFISQQQLRKNKIHRNWHTPNGMHRKHGLVSYRSEVLGKLHVIFHQDKKNGKKLQRLCHI